MCCLHCLRNVYILNLYFTHCLHTLHHCFLDNKLVCSSRVQVKMLACYPDIFKLLNLI